MLDYQDQLGTIIHLLAERQYGMTITSIAAESGIGRNRVAKYLDVLTLSGRTGMKQVGNAKVFYLISRIPVASMLNLSSDFIIVVDDEHNVAYVTDNLLEEEHLSRKEVIGTNISELGLSLIPFPNLTDRIHQTLAGAEVTGEYAVPNGWTHRWFRAKMIPTTLEGGGGGAGIVLKDITDLKKYQDQTEEQIYGDGTMLTASTENRNQEREGHEKAENELKKLEQSCRDLISLAREGIIAINPVSGIITFVNPTMTDILGYTAGEMQGRSVFTLTNDAGVRLLREKLAEVMKGNDGEGEMVLFRRDGAKVYVEVTSTSMNSSGDSGSRWILLIKDVTDRKEKEASLRFTNTLLNGIIEGSNRMVATIDTGFTFITANSAYTDEFERVFGRVPEPGKQIEDLLSHLPDDREKALGLWRRALQGEDFCTVQQFGNENEYEIWFFPLRDEKGRIFGAANLINDITSLEKAVTAFQVQDVQLREIMKQASIQSS